MIIKKSDTSYKAEQGSLFFYVFIVVGLFAALAFVVSSSERGSVQTITKQQASMYASEILDYATLVQDAVSKLRLNGCQENEISFERTPSSEYENTFSPSDFSCHVFKPEGGGLEFYAFPEEIVGENPYYWNTRFTGDINLNGVGSAGKTEMIMMVPMRYKEEICQALNYQLGIAGENDSVPSMSGSHYSAVFSSANGPYTENMYETVPSAFRGFRAGCHSRFDRQTGLYIFFYALLVR